MPLGQCASSRQAKHSPEPVSQYPGAQSSSVVHFSNSGLSTVKSHAVSMPATRMTRAKEILLMSSP